MAKKAVFGIVNSEDQAVRIVDELRNAGFSRTDISALFPDKRGTRDFAHEQHTKAPEGAATGAGTGTSVSTRAEITRNSRDISCAVGNTCPSGGRRSTQIRVPSVMR